MAPSTAPQTLFLAKLIGPTALLVGLSMLMKKAAMIDTVTAFMNDGPLLFATSVISIAAGLAIVLNHNIWSRGALATVVTLVGWLILIKGALILFLSPEQSASVVTMVHYQDWFYVYSAFPTLLGLYLTLAGYKIPPLR